MNDVSPSGLGIILPYVRRLTPNGRDVSLSELAVSQWLNSHRFDTPERWGGFGFRDPVWGNRGDLGAPFLVASTNQHKSGNWSRS